MTAPRAVSQPCVSVSTTETTGPNSETRVPAIGHQYAVREAINTLIEFGFTVGCDGELLPPRCGMPGTMRIQQYRGRDWVTSRLGPSGPVEL